MFYRTIGKIQPGVREVCCQMTDQGKDDSREERKQDKGQGEKAKKGSYDKYLFVIVVVVVIVV